MNAERLRAAAKRLRDVAGAATPGPWAAAEGDGRDDWPVSAPEGYLCHSPDDGVRGGHTKGDADYIAMMHPPVALALADWLDTTANDAQHVHDPFYNLTSTTVSRALLVADAVLDPTEGEGSE